MGEINTREVRAAAGAIEDVASTVRHQVPDEVGQIAQALAGSASGVAGTTLATTWATAFSSWVADAEALAQSMRDAAANWDAADQVAAVRFHRQGATAV